MLARKLKPGELWRSRLNMAVAYAGSPGRPVGCGGAFRPALRREDGGRSALDAPGEGGKPRRILDLF